VSMVAFFRHRVDALGERGGDAAAAVAQAWRTELVAIDALDGTVGESYALRGGGGGVVGSALIVDGKLAHLAAAVGG